jgi:hypothetical protein
MSVIIKCKICNKEIEGYKRSHAEYLLMRHQEVHKKEEEKKNEQQKE